MNIRPIERYSIVLGLFLFNTLLSHSQSLFTTLHLNEERDIHKGIPKQITEWQVFYNTHGTETKKYVTQYDKWGLPTSVTRFNEDDNISSISTNVYDTIKRVILEDNINELNVRFPTNRVKTVYYYENARSPVKIEQMDPNGIVVTRVIIKNDSTGLPVEQWLFEPLDHLVGIETASYDTANNLAIISVANNQGRVLSIDSLKISFKEAYRYNNPRAVYNDKGDITSSQSKWPNGIIHCSEFKYIYDKTGNWIEKKVFDVTYKANGKNKRTLKSYSKREIVYHSINY